MSEKNLSAAYTLINDWHAPHGLHEERVHALGQDSGPAQSWCVIAKSLSFGRFHLHWPSGGGAPGLSALRASASFGQ